ncbi:tetratricopeptide repeat protein [Lysobacter humi (ex Lee et al. 2017)]
MKLPTFRRQALAAVLIAMTAAPVAYAQDENSTDRRTAGGARRAAQQEKAKAAEAAKAATAQPQRYPQAKRVIEAGKATSKGAKALEAMIELDRAGKDVEARAAADAILGDTAFNAYERATAAHVAANASIGAKDYAAALKYAEQAIASNALANNDHYDLMLLRAQLQVAAKDYATALASIEQFLSETGEARPEHLAIKGNALYRLERYADAVTVLKPAVDALPDRADLKALLADAYARTGNAAEATKLTASVASANPADPRAQMNLAITYMQAGQYEKVAEVLERMRAAGQLKDDDGYRQLFTAYTKIKDKEAQTIAVIEDGLAKGVLKPDYNVYLALGQSYYFTDDTDKAIEAYKKAAPLAPNGETWLNLARIYKNGQRISEAKQAAQQALSKGVKNSAEAEKIVAMPGK